jgi:hypothetical protein
MKPYTFYIKDGKAVSHPIGGGNISSFAGSSSNPAVNVQAQGSKVIVTYENGKVEEWPWPGQGGNIRTLVEGRSRPQRQASSHEVAAADGPVFYTGGIRSSAGQAVFQWLAILTILGPLTLNWYRHVWANTYLAEQGSQISAFWIGEAIFAALLFAFRKQLGLIFKGVLYAAIGLGILYLISTIANKLNSPQAAPNNHESQPTSPTGHTR